jgi:hypothetical protein
MLNSDVYWITCEMDVTCDLLCWITTILACMLVGLKSLVISLDYRSYMGSSVRIWSLRWMFLYLCSYNLDGSVTAPTIHQPLREVRPSDDWANDKQEMAQARDVLGELLAIEGDRHLQPVQAPLRHPIHHVDPSKQDPRGPWRWWIRSFPKDHGAESRHVEGELPYDPPPYGLGEHPSVVPWWHRRTPWQPDGECLADQTLPASMGPRSEGGSPLPYGRAQPERGGFCLPCLVCGGSMVEPTGRGPKISS